MIVWILSGLISLLSNPARSFYRQYELCFNQQWGSGAARYTADMLFIKLNTPRLIWIKTSFTMEIYLLLTDLQKHCKIFAEICPSVLFCDNDCSSHCQMALYITLQWSYIRIITLQVARWWSKYQIFNDLRVAYSNVRNSTFESPCMILTFHRYTWLFYTYSSQCQMIPELAKSLISSQ